MHSILKLGSFSVTCYFHNGFHVFWTCHEICTIIRQKTENLNMWLEESLCSGIDCQLCRASKKSRPAGNKYLFCTEQVERGISICCIFYWDCKRLLDSEVTVCCRLHFPLLTLRIKTLGSVAFELLECCSCRTCSGYSLMFQSFHDCASQSVIRLCKLCTPTGLKWRQDCIQYCLDA